MSSKKVTLIQVKGNSYFCSGIFSIGVYAQGTDVILIDSGSDDSSAKEASAAIQEAGLTVSAIITTHCHPDHCGGNSFFQKKFPNLKTYATYDEKYFIEDPKIAPRVFCAGAAPLAGLQNKHIGPQKPSTITNVITPYQDQAIEVSRAGVHVITLPGHTMGMIGIITPDNILYCGDALFGQSTLIKHPVILYTDIEATLATFKKLASLSVEACVLYHGGVIHDLSALVARHEQAVIEIKNRIAALLDKQQLSLDLITQHVMKAYNIANTIIAFTLTQTTVRAYLAYLEKEKKIEVVVQNGLLQFRDVT